MPSVAISFETVDSIHGRRSTRFRKQYLTGAGDALWSVALIVAKGEHGDRQTSRVVKRLTVSSYGA
jgi:hypothetical protein